MKKHNENELLTKEINSLVVSDKEAKQKIYYLEKELNETKD